MITKAVMVQITTVSIKGSNKATKPSEAGYFVFTAECAIDAEPAPASFEKAARLNPVIKHSKKTPKSSLRIKGL